MEVSFWAVIKAKKQYHSWRSQGVSVRKAKPSTGPNEAAVKISIDIPDAYFETPELSVAIKVPEDALNKLKITPNVQHNIGKLIEKQLGIKVHVSHEEPSED